MENWANARTLPAFADLFAGNPPPLPPSIPSPNRNGSSGGSNLIASALPPPLATVDLHPWRRYFARMIDYSVFSVVVGLNLVILFPSQLNGNTAGIPNQAFELLVLAVYIPVEAILLATVGTTFGKYLYQIKLTPEHSFTFSSAFRRSLLVWWRGVGTGFPLATMITASIAFSNLNKNGITSWDLDCGCQISHSPISGPRWIAIYAIVGLMLVITIAGAASS